MVPHGFARDDKHAGELAINAGVDMDMQGSVFYNYLAELVDEGKVSVKTIFAYSDITLQANQLSNTGDRFGEEVVQLYTRQLVGSVTRPLKELKVFQKIGLEPGETREVVFTLTPADLAFYNRNNEFKPEPGEFHLFIGSSSVDVKQAEFSLLP